MHKYYSQGSYAERGRHAPRVNVSEVPWLVILMTFALSFHDELWTMKYVI